MFVAKSGIRSIATWDNFVISPFTPEENRRTPGCYVSYLMCRYAGR